VRRIRGPRERGGFALVELVCTLTILALVIGALVDIVIVGLRGPQDSKPHLAAAEIELAIARFVSADVLPSVSATPHGSACGVTRAALVTTKKSLPSAIHADEAVAYTLGTDGLTRATCATGATAAATTTLVSGDVTVFIASCRPPGACGTVHIEAETSGTDASAHHFSLDVNRKLKK
jgi:hypothetical protein